MVGIAIAATAVVTVRQRKGRGRVDRWRLFMITRRDFTLTEILAQEIVLKGCSVAVSCGYALSLPEPDPLWQLPPFDRVPPHPLRGSQAARPGPLEPINILVFISALRVRSVKYGWLMG